MSMSREEKKEIRNNKNAMNRLAFQGGSYSLIISAIVLAVLVVVNVLATTLPSTWTQLDISSAQLYSVTSNTKVVLNNLEEDVTIYWIVQSGSENSILQNLLDKYDSLSDHVTVVKKNPDVYPTFAEQYTDETVTNNSLVVECGGKSRYIAWSDIYQEELSYYGMSLTRSFDGEGCITSAIDYVVSDELPIMYVLEGHGEEELPETFAEQIEKSNIETQSLSLLTVDEIPEDADCVLIYEPQSDLSEDEVEMLSDWVYDGGKLMVIAGPVDGEDFENLNSLLEYYGVTVEEGVVIEAERTNYVYYPYLLLPNIQSDDITDALIEENYYVVMPIASGLTVSEDSGSNGTVTELLTTSESAFSKLDGYGLTTYEMEDGDIEGPFALAVSIESNNGGRLVWFSSADFLDDSYNSYSSGANVDITLNAISNMIGEREALAISSRSLDYNYLTISDSAASMLKLVMIGVFPLAYLGIGVCILLRRRNLQK
ncbi:MAG: GldG family protein [Lachnospiraceae bacterium]|nr:GldG family protein [Lachnospiraceae bacterium]